MKTLHARRRFLQTALVLAAGPASRVAWSAAAASAGSPTPDPKGLTTYQQGPQIWIRWNNRVVTSYRAHRTQKYPYLYPLAGPLTGLSLTVETALPWPHHCSLFFGCDRVNGGNYWQEGFDQGQILSQGPRLEQSTHNSVELRDQCDWQKPGGPTVMRDQRRVVFTQAGARLRFIDWEIRWTAVVDVVVPQTNHSLFALRAAPDLTPGGGGQLLNAEGLSGEKETFGKKSAWCDFSGPRETRAGPVVEGITLMDHPKNPWAPTPWFTRDYGFMSPTPLFFLEQPWALPAGQSVTLRYRVVLHGGMTPDAGLDAVFRQWSAA